MRPDPVTDTPADAARRRAVRPVICHPVETLPRPDLSTYRALREDLELMETVFIPPRDAGTLQHFQGV